MTNRRAVKRKIIGGVIHSKCSHKNCRKMVPDPHNNRRSPKIRYCAWHLKKYNDRQEKLRDARTKTTTETRAERSRDPKPEDFTAENRDGLWEDTAAGPISDSVRMAMLKGDVEEFLRLTEPQETER